MTMIPILKAEFDKRLVSAHPQYAKECRDAIIEYDGSHYGMTSLDYNRIKARYQNAHVIPEPWPVAPKRTVMNQPPQQSLTHWGTAMWKEFHQRPFKCDLTKEAIWLNLFAARVIACSGCRAHWKDLMQRNPPNLSSHKKYAEWQVVMHNAVNIRIDHPVISYAVAARIWRWE